jgi:hypothetical protein
MRPSLLAFASLSLLVTACGATQDQLRARAAFDFKCPASQIQLTEIDSRTTGVDACGKRATYVESCSGPKGAMTTECTWVLNSSDNSTP